MQKSRLVAQHFAGLCYERMTTGVQQLVGVSSCQAAHHSLRPHILCHFQKRNDDPRNGLALTPTFHVALDRNLIAPGPDMKWCVSPAFDKRIPDNRPFVDLAGQDVIYFGEEKFRPREDYLGQG